MLRWGGWGRGPATVLSPSGVAESGGSAVFVFFSNRLGCVMSLVVSVALTALLLFILNSLG